MLFNSKSSYLFLSLKFEKLATSAKARNSSVESCVLIINSPHSSGCGYILLDIIECKMAHPGLASTADCRWGLVRELLRILIWNAVTFVLLHHHLMWLQRTYLEGGWNVDERGKGEDLILPYFSINLIPYIKRNMTSPEIFGKISVLIFFRVNRKVAFYLSSFQFLDF